VAGVRWAEAVLTREDITSGSSRSARETTHQARFEFEGFRPQIVDDVAAVRALSIR
jgi:hypothetical protein